MADQDERKRYLMEVQTWLEQVCDPVFEEAITEVDITSYITRTQEDVLEYLSEEDVNEYTLEEINNAVRHIDKVLKERLGDDGRERESIAPGRHELPPLGYSYSALEPYINREIMRLHHSKHHQSYVDGLNKAELMLQQARNTNNFDLIKHWEREAAFHGSGHYLHTIFWEIMSPEGGGRPRRQLLQQLQKDFGSYEKFMMHFSQAAKKVEGVGWAILVWSPRSRKLEVLQAERHQLLTQWDTIPLLVLDVWEHAYYLQYKNERDPYVDNWWKIIYWPNVEKRFEAAKMLQWQPY
ncbi:MULTISPECIES: superoxide dismutase [Priestia]|jgi:Fe-Mn family superoxide dismutase|uniref:superoxide dismutase n=1 Tax=Priestia megaterium TaxID=1404 RepID=A0A2C3IYS9_PRIMG|nr:MULTISPECIES: superoxide dismutase [Priestia]KQU11770.1 superoxide dismutase [Bacillus sp. Leaf75]KRF56186.1 superoxide dismutase [Bacillus sp. Soil531]MCF6796599.1 superoxide dismutase [Bacillus sp. ET1]MDH6654267.1 Fe-Mn family superoxide dismutase [Bacillus sp. PvP124]MDP9575606.1 Fe-Mn family superoxide dismutase [Bacillus sp. 1751]MEB2275547.1 superoxide dismutase [Bacillus sp. ILBB4]RFB29328.1 superoxide dismutase [Bacillus sp. ALD]RFB41270.1 superoxide dismutase [Bacillus sp. RC]